MTLDFIRSYLIVPIIEKGKEYRNLDGLLKFINMTLENNKDVYFVTARQAIEYVKLMPMVERSHLNLTKLVEEEVLGSTNTLDSSTLYDGKCDLLNFEKPDFDIDEVAEYDEWFKLDDSYGVEKNSDIVHKLNKTVLLDLQSEVLFVHREVIWLVIGLGLMMLIIIVHDKV